MSDLGPMDPELTQLFRDEPMPEPPDHAEARVAAKLAAAGLFAVPLSPIGTLRKMLLPITTFFAGAGLGAAAVVAFQPKPVERAVYIDRPVVSAVPSVSVAPPLPSASVRATPQPRVPAMGTSAPATDNLREERALLDTSRSKLSGGDAASALEHLSVHERRFARGRLVEEREALMVQALVNAGRYDEARARAAELARRYPKSVYLPAVTISLESIP